MQPTFGCKAALSLMLTLQDLFLLAPALMTELEDRPSMDNCSHIRILRLPMSVADVI